MQGTPNSGTVPAEETYCSRNPDLTFSIEPGGAYYGWAIFHNVPWEGGVVSLEWGDKGSSAWVDPWASPYPLAQFPPPVECPDELVTLGTCQVPREPHGTASNLIVLVHGYCTDANDVKTDWDSMGRAIGAQILHDQPPGTWEIVVKDWSSDTPKWDPNFAYDKAAAIGGVGETLATAISRADPPYSYIHLIAHSAVSKLIDVAAKWLVGYSKLNSHSST